MLVVAMAVQLVLVSQQVCGSERFTNTAVIITMATMYQIRLTSDVETNISNIKPDFKCMF